MRLRGSGYETTHSTASNRKLGGDLGTETKDLNFTASCKRKVWVAPPLLEIAVLNPGFRTGFFLGGWENVDACKGCMRASVHPLDFNELWTYLRTRNIRSSYNTVSMLPIVAFEAIMTSNFWGRENSDWGRNPSVLPFPPPLYETLRSINN